MYHSEESNIKLPQNNCCNGSTTTGKPCKKRVKSDKFCRHHKNQNIDEKNSPKGEIIDPNVTITQKCSGFTKSGKKCKKIYKHNGKFCHIHSTSEDSNNTLFIPRRAKQNYYSIDDKDRK